MPGTRRSTEIPLRSWRLKRCSPRRRSTSVVTPLPPGATARWTFVIPAVAWMPQRAHGSLSRSLPRSLLGVAPGSVWRRLPGSWRRTVDGLPCEAPPGLAPPFPCTFCWPHHAKKPAQSGRHLLSRRANSTPPCPGRTPFWWLMMNLPCVPSRVACSSGPGIPSPWRTAGRRRSTSSRERGRRHCCSPTSACRG